MSQIPMGWLIAAKVLITDEAAQTDLAPSGWIKNRQHPASVVTFVLSLPAEQAHLLLFQLFSSTVGCHRLGYGTILFAET